MPAWPKWARPMPDEESPNREKRAAALELLTRSGAVPADARVEDLSQLEGGWSRHTYIVSVSSGDNAEARRFVIRVRPAGGVLDTDIEQEFRLYELLDGEAVPTPAVHGIERSEDNPFGGPFFAMDFVAGDPVNVWRPRDRERLEKDWYGERTVAAGFTRCLADIHSIDPDKFDGVVEAKPYQVLLDHWQGVHREMELISDPVIEDAYAWAREREPEPVAPALVHGDYRIGNTLIDRGQISTVLDWELSFVGDPRFDLSYMALPYHAGKFAKPGSDLLCAVADTDWFHRRYRELTGRDVDREAIRTFTVVGGLMLIAIFVTGIRAYEREQTRDIRLPWGRFALPGLRQDLTSLMDW